MKIKLYHDSRRGAAEASVCLRVTVRKNTVLIATGVRVSPNQWDATNGKVIGHVRRNAYNSYLQNVRAKAEGALLDYSLRNDLAALSKDELRKLVLSAGRDEVEQEEEKPTFAKWYVEFMGTKAARTQEIYRATYKRMLEYDKNLEQRTFEEITKKWLQGFDTYMTPQSPSVNARSIHFRNIRAVFNDALDEEVTQVYPFRKFKIRREATRKRSLTVEQLRAFFNAPTKDVEEKYLDFFKLIFMLIGINIIDLCRLKEVVNGRVEYKRAKTKRLYSVKVEPEAMAIIEKYKGKEWLLSPLDTYKGSRGYKSFADHLNEHLQMIGDTKREGRGGRKVFNPMFPEITTYWARHTWATIAASLDIPKETIAHALGHASAFSSVTDVYIDFDMRKVDEANRRVLDWVLYEKK